MSYDKRSSNEQPLASRGQNMKKVMIAFILILFSIGCTPAYHQERLTSSKEREMTVGLVQKEIRVGMSQTDVAEALGSPNIVTRDKNGKVSWVYDKIASEASYSKSNVSGVAGGGGTTGNTLLLGLISGGYESGASSTTQKTLTVVIKFDQDHLVETFSYHSSKF
jgi:outer membrane protein assembly factor BamE (lipoprotein component of BamABCDE complex)